MMWVIHHSTARETFKADKQQTAFRALQASGKEYTLETFSDRVVFWERRAICGTSMGGKAWTHSIQ